jgi:acyl-CoA synthetase
VLCCLEIRDEGKADSPQKRAKLAHDSLERGSQPSSDGYPEPIRGISVTIPAGAVLTSASRAPAGCASHAAVTGLAQEWSVRLSKCIDATPLVITWSGARTGNSVTLVIVGSHGGDLVAVNAAMGQEAWKLQLGEHIEAAAVLDASTGLLFVGTFSGQDVDGFVSRRPVGSTSEAALGCLWAINAETGVVCWHVCTKGEIKSAAVVLGSTMVVGSYDGHVYHIRCRDGHLMDKHACGGSIFAAPVVLCDEQRLLAVTTSGIVTLFALGQDEQPLAVLSSAHMVSMFSTPLACTVNGASCALLAGTDGSLRCVRAESGLGEVWCESVSSTSFFSSACVVPGAATADAEGSVATAVIGCHDGKLRKVSLVEGAVLWECVLGVAIFASPRLLQGGEDCVVATVAGDVVVVSVATGQVRAKMRLPAEVFSSPVYHAGHLYVGCRDDKLYCVMLL